MKDDIAIRISHIGKTFKVPHEKHSSLKAAAVNILSTRKFTKFKALEDINFEINKGEFFGIVGKNGSGKSTLLKILANIYQPSSGKIKINGTLAPFIELGVGFNPELTGRENVYLSGTILGMKKKKIEEIYDEIVDFAEIGEFMDQKLKNYSSGMQVRLAFSIAVRAESDILLIDEVLAVGDAAFQAKCFDYFYKLKEAKKTIVFVSHNMDSVKKFCDRAAYIRDGNIAVLGKTEDVADMYSIDNYNSVKDELISTSKVDKTKQTYIQGCIVKNATVKPNDVIEVVVDVISKKEQEVVVAISFVREDGVYVAGYNSSDDIKKLILHKNKNSFKCTIEKDQLTSARYSVNVALFEPFNLDLIDSLSGTAGFKVLNTVIDKDGTFNIKGRWKKND